MSDNDGNSSSSVGVDVVGLLGVAFVVLKLMGIIDWSWWWVTLPFWGRSCADIGLDLDRSLGRSRLGNH